MPLPDPRTRHRPDLSFGTLRAKWDERYREGLPAREAGHTVGQVRARWLAGVVLLVAAGCSSAGSEAAPTTAQPTSELLTTTTTAPPREPSTTTTAFDPASVEGAVEAAYLKSWDVYADAVYNLELDESALSEVYADPLLGVRRNEITSRIAEDRAALVSVEHRYQVNITGAETAIVIDKYVNHQVLIDPLSKQPIEDDPNETIVDASTARLVNRQWVFFDLRRLS